MTELDVVISKLAIYDQRFSNIEESIKEIKNILTKVAVQDERILHIDNKVNKLFSFHDDAYGKDGIITHIINHQRKCPVEIVHKNSISIDELRNWIFRIALGLGVFNLGTAIILYVIK